MGRAGTIHERNELRIYLENHLMTMNLLNASVEAGVKLFFASSACVYPGGLAVWTNAKTSPSVNLMLTLPILQVSTGPRAILPIVKE